MSMTVPTARSTLGPLKARSSFETARVEMSNVDIELSTAANQVRVSDTSNVKLFLYSHTDPTFEKVSSCQIGPYNFSYPKLREHVEAVGKLE